MSLARNIALLSILATAPALADSSPWIALGVQNPECTCRFGGANLALGAQICVPTQQGMRMAECVMEQNVTSWKAGPLPCPVSRLRLFSPRQHG